MRRRVAYNVDFNQSLVFVGIYAVCLLSLDACVVVVVVLLNNLQLHLFHFQMIISLLMIIPGDIGSLIDFFSFTSWIFYGMTVLALIVLRFKDRDAKRPYKVGQTAIDS